MRLALNVTSASAAPAEGKQASLAETQAMDAAPDDQDDPRSEWCLIPRLPQALSHACVLLTCDLDLGAVSPPRPGSPVDPEEQKMFENLRRDMNV